MRFVGLKNCHTCRKALRGLQAAGNEPQIFDVRADGVNAAGLAQILQICSAKSVNLRSTPWRVMSESVRGEAPSELLSRHRTIMKRPLVATVGKYYLGCDTQTRAALLG